ncbi:hypothetical protein G6F56_003234 [Rhizopus delemar]|uniref:Uncharacterized protein n=1 Tax=Rhizopus stolonifer TaxID=4846 RepID=A0A367ITM3_RHIST|nr:hypothetical protein G6F56_003234 [Rhizopus delemar]RCH81002.1 hypothetical protein CU098_005303 [Rhizopus stolonifer]
MSLKDRQEIQDEEESRFEEPLEFNETFMRRKQRKPIPRVDHLSVQDVQAILMENYSLRQELNVLHHQFQSDRISLERQLRRTLARNDYLETRWAQKKRQERDDSIFQERRKSLGDIERPFYPQVYYPQEEGEEEEEEDEEGRFMMHLSPQPNFGPPPGYPPLVMRRRSKSRYEEDDEPPLHLMNQMTLGPLRSPHHSSMGPSQRRRKPSFM